MSVSHGYYLGTFEGRKGAALFLLCFKIGNLLGFCLSVMGERQPFQVDQETVMGTGQRSEECFGINDQTGLG